MKRYVYTKQKRTSVPGQMRVKISQIIQANRLAKEFLVQSQRKGQVDDCEIVDSQSTHNPWERMLALYVFPSCFFSLTPSNKLP